MEGNEEVQEEEFIEVKPLDEPQLTVLTPSYHKPEDPQEDLYYDYTAFEQHLVTQFLEGNLNFSDFARDVLFKGNDAEQEEAGPSQESNQPTIPEVKSTRYRTNKKLPPALKGLMGEANLRVARGDNETAVKMCLEIIRQAPYSSEPYTTLAGIYEDMGEDEKYLQMSLVAAHLSTDSDAFQWAHLAKLSEEAGDLKQAITCYNKAIKLDLRNMELHRKRADLLNKVGDKHNWAIKGYSKLLLALTPEEGEYVVSLAKFVAELFHKQHDLEQTNHALEIAVCKCPNLINYEFVNLHLEVLLQLKNYSRCLEILKTFCKFQISSSVREDGSLEVDYCELPPQTPVDIVCKFAVLLIHLKATRIVSQVMAPLEQMEVSDVGEFYLDIIDAYTEEGCHNDACSLLLKLVNTSAYSLPGVWLKFAENLKQLGRVDEAIEAYKRVLEQASHHTSVRKSLAELLISAGRNSEAIMFLDTDDPEDTDGLMLRCQLLITYAPHRHQELIYSAVTLFSRHWITLKNRLELTNISTLSKLEKKRATIFNFRTEREPLPPIKDMDEAAVFAQWTLFKRVCQVCIDLKFFETFHKLVFSAQTSTVFTKFKYELDLLCVVASVLVNDPHHGYNVCRTMLSKDLNNARLWHLFNLVVNKSDTNRHSRFVIRQLACLQSHRALGLLHGNYCLSAGTYKYALHEYAIAFKTKPQAYIAFLVSIIYFLMAGQKFNSRRHSLVEHGMSWFQEYQKLRGPGSEQEVHYNLGRAFQHLGLYNTAIYHYKQVIDAPKNSLCLQHPDKFDLTKEAAYNLYVLYSLSGSHDLATLYITNHIVI